MLQLPGMPLLISPVASGAVITPHGGYGVSREGARGNGAVHKGVDLALDDGTPVYAAAGGVVRTGYDAPAQVDANGVNHGGGGGGNFVGVKDPDTGYELMYMHLGSISVSDGQSVVQGQQIGVGGHSGAKTSGAHLHFEIRHPDDFGRNNIDPTEYLPLGAGALPFDMGGDQVTSDSGSVLAYAALGVLFFVLWKRFS